MLNQIDELLSIIVSLTGAYSNIKEAFSERYHLIISGDIEKLAANISKINIYLSELKSLESQRQTLLVDLSAKFKINPADLNISKLCRLFPDKADNLKNLQTGTLDLISDIKIADNRSNRLLKNNLEQIKWLLMALDQDINDLSMYNKELSQSSSYSLFDETV